MPTTEILTTITNYDIGIAEQGGPPAIAIRFHLPNNSTLAVAMPPELAAGLMLQLHQYLLKLANKPAPTTN
jgi:hypothetical protein